MEIEKDSVAEIEINVSEYEDEVISDNSNKNLVKTNDEIDDLESSIDYKVEDEKNEHMPLVDKKTQKHKTRSSKKPPRPRKGPSLSTSDLRLVKEISELVIKKRARVDRLKSLKKMRASKPSSTSSSSSSLSKTSLVAMIITLLFFIIIVFQGISKLEWLNFIKRV